MLIATFENLLNRGLPRSPRARQLCAELVGRQLALDMPHVLRLRLQSTGQTLRLSADAEPADAEVRGGPASLLALARAPLRPLPPGVEVHGDALVLERFRELLELLTPDAEEELSLLIGDVGAHQLGRTLRGLAGWSRAAASTATRNLAEYLAHESRDLVPRTEVEHFFREIDLLREDADRLAARLELLKPRTGAP